MTVIPALPNRAQPWSEARKRMATSADAAWFRSLDDDQRLEVRIQVCEQVAKKDVNTEGPRLAALIGSIAVAAAVLGSMLSLVAEHPAVAEAVEVPMAAVALGTLFGAVALFCMSPLEAQKRAVALSWQTLIDHAGVDAPTPAQAATVTAPPGGVPHPVGVN